MSSSSLDEDRAQPLDRLQQLGQLVEDLLPLEAGEPLELHVEDGLRLDLREAERASSGPSRASGGFFDAANQRDDRVEVVERDLQAFEDVRARLGLAQLELDPAPHDLAAELDEVLDDLEQRAARAAGRPTIASSVMPKLVCSFVCL